MSGASSTVSSMVKSGAISTMPPTLAAAMIAITKPMAVRSILRWKNSGMASLRRGRGRSGSETCVGNVGLPLGSGGRLAHRHPDVEGGDDGTEQEEQSAEG